MRSEGRPTPQKLTIGVIGGGIVGVAIARALTMSTDHQVTVIEKESHLAAHQTGHNSGVVHAGIYYAPGSLKARLCAAGRVRTREFCAQKNLPYHQVGKLVVATSAEEVGRLDDLEKRATANAVPGLRRLTRSEMREIEPHSDGVAALHSPETSAVDYGAITEAMADDVRDAGGTILLNEEVTAIRRLARGVVVDTAVVDTTVTEHRFDRLIVCAGLHADLVGIMAGAEPSPKILPFRGEYWDLDPAKNHLVRGMIYPVPDPRFPFLGVHFTRDVHDNVRIGPNAVPALAREGYSWGSISARDTWESITWPGAFPLFTKHWRMGLREITASVIKPFYFSMAKQFVPELKMEDLVSRSAAGVRAQAWGRDGALLDDFAVDRLGDVTVLRNAPSPAATSSMAIADYVLENYFALDD